MRFLFLMLLVALLVPLGAATPEPTSRAWKTVAPGLEYRSVRLTSLRDATMHQIRADLGKLRLGLLYAPDFGSKTLSISELVVRSGALAGINASYFDPELQALGYLRQGDRVLVEGIATGKAFTGFLQITQGRARVLPRDDFRPDRVDLALQAGPRLIADAEAVAGVHPGEPHRRTGVAVDSKGRLILYATGLASSLTLTECQRALLLPADQGGVDPVSALNLDGGSSTQMFLRAGSFQAMAPGLTPVPVGLGVFPKKGAPPRRGP